MERAHGRDRAPEVVTNRPSTAYQQTLRHCSYESLYLLRFVEISCMVGVLGAVSVKLQTFRGLSIMVPCK